MRTHTYGLTCNSKGHALRRPKDVLIWLYKTKKLPRDKDFCINILLLKLSLHHNRLTIRKEDIRITCLKLNNKTYIFLSSKILSNSIWSLISLINFFHHNCLILQQNWLRNNLRDKSSAMMIVISNDNK